MSAGTARPVACVQGDIVNVRVDYRPWKDGCGPANRVREVYFKFEGGEAGARRYTSCRENGLRDVMLIDKPAGKSIGS
jgi:hypothetical protein